MADAETLEQIQKAAAQVAMLAAETEKRAGAKFKRYFPDCQPGCTPTHHLGLCRAAYPKHVAFMQAGSQHRERLFLAANQIGKCTTIGSVIDTPHGPTPLATLLSRGEPFDVWAWDSARGRRVAARASAPFRKTGLHFCYRVTMAHGQVIEIADEHRLLTLGGWQRLSQLLPQFAPCRLASTPARALSVRREDGSDYLERPQDYRSYCGPALRHDGVRPRAAQGVGRGGLQQQADAPTHILPSWRAGALACIDTRSRRARSGRHASTDDQDHFVGQCAGSSSRSVCTIAGPWYGLRRAEWLPRVASVDPPQPCDGPALRIGDSASGSRPLALALDSNSIVSCEPIGYREVYDFEVREWRSYISADLIHHNTECAGYEVTAHLTGLYPSWWRGRRFEEAGEWWLAGDTMLSTRNILQVAMLGPIDRIETRSWSGMIPQHLVDDFSRKSGGVTMCIDTVWVKHVSGKRSSLQFLSYDQGRKIFQGTGKQGIWLDEEPPEGEDIYSECLTRTVTTNGIVLCTFTPLRGLTAFIQQYLETATMVADDGTEATAAKLFWGDK